MRLSCCGRLPVGVSHQTMLPNSPDVEQAIMGPGGVLEGIGEGMLYIDMSTIAPSTSREVYGS